MAIKIIVTATAVLLSVLMSLNLKASEKEEVRKLAVANSIRLMDPKMKEMMGLPKGEFTKKLEEDKGETLKKCLKALDDGNETYC